MKRMEKLLLLSFLLRANLSASNTLDLQQAQAMMFFNNIEMNIARQEYCQKDYELTEAKSAWYPSLDLFGSLGYQNKKNTIFLPIQSSLFPSGPLTMGVKYRSDMGVELTYPITSAIVNIFKVKYRQNALLEKSALDMALRNRLSFKLGALYFLWDLSYSQMNVKKMLVTHFEAMVAHLKNMQAGGMSATSKVLENMAGLENARAQLVTEENRVDSLKLEILNFIQSEDSAVVPEEYQFNFDSLLAEIDTLSLNLYRPELSAIDVNIDQLNAYYDVLVGQKYPNLFLSAAYHYGKPELQMSNDPDYMGYAAAALQVRFNLYNGNKISSQQRQTQQQIEIARKRKLQAINEFDNSIRSAKAQYFRAKRQKDAAHLALEASRAVVNDVKNSLDAGVVTLLDYQNAVIAEATAELSVKQADCMQKMALLKIYYAVGKEIKY